MLLPLRGAPIAPPDGPYKKQGNPEPSPEGEGGPLAGDEVLAKGFCRVYLALAPRRFSKNTTYSSSVFCFAKSTFSRRRRQRCPQIYANKDGFRGFAGNLAGGRLPPLHMPMIWNEQRGFLQLSTFERGSSRRRSALTPGFFHRHSARKNRVSAVESHRKRYNISFSRLPPLRYAHNRL